MTESPEMTGFATYIVSASDRNIQTDQSKCSLLTETLAVLTGFPRNGSHIARKILRKIDFNKLKQIYMTRNILEKILY